MKKSRFSFLVAGALTSLSSASKTVASPACARQNQSGADANYIFTKQDARANYSVKETGADHEKRRATWTRLAGYFKAKADSVTAGIQRMKKAATAWARHAHAKRYALYMTTSAPACC